MSTFKPTVFRSSDTGAPVLDGQAGTMVGVLDHCLVIGRVFSYNGASFNDNTPEARLDGGTPFALFPDGDTNDELYLGHTAKFSAAAFDLDTLGVGGTYVWEYWNGAWVSLTRVDGTNGFTQDGVVTWTPPGDWVTNTVNSVTMFWVRVRCTGAPSPNPTAVSITATGWVIAYTGTNKRVYRTCALGGGNRFFLRVDDTGTVDGRARGFETMSDVDTGTGLFPTDAQVSGGVFWKKSATADATARPWILVGDDRTFYFFTLNGITSTTYAGMLFGDIYSYKSGDAFRTAIMGHSVTTNTSANYRFGYLSTADTGDNNLGTLQAGLYLARGYAGTGGSVNYHQNTNSAFHPTSPTVYGYYGVVTYPNPADGGLYLGEVSIWDTTAHLRGRYRGLWCPMHVATSFADGDTFSGAGALAGRTFLIVRIVIGGNGSLSSSNGCAVLETSDTWVTN